MDEMVQITTNTFYNSEQEREAKAQEREKKKEISHAQMVAALQGKLYGKAQGLEEQRKKVKVKSLTLV